MIVRFLLLSLGVFCAATSVVMTKASELSPEWLSAGRLFIATLVLLPVYLRDKRLHGKIEPVQSIVITTIPALLLASHFITWAIGARWTTAANATLIVNLIPVAMPILGYWMLKEVLNAREWIGTSFALAGIAILAFEDFQLSEQLLFGDTICLVSMLLMAAYLMLARKYRSLPSIWLYLLPLYFQAGLMCAAAGLIRTGLPATADKQEWMNIILLGLVSTVCGHSLLNRGMQWFRSQTVALVNQKQFVYAGLLGFFFFNEIPQRSFYLASAFMLTGVGWMLFSKSWSDRREAD